VRRRFSFRASKRMKSRLRSSAVELDEKCLPRYCFIINHAKHHENRNSVEEAVAAEGPPIQFGGCRGAQSTDRYNEHYVKNSATDNAAYLKRMKKRI